MFLLGFYVAVSPLFAPIFFVMPLRGGEILFPTAGKVSKSALNVYFE
jgi:hypothetical protein